MRYGCCVNMVTRTGNISGIDIIPLLKTAGFDYAELSISHLCKLNDQELLEVIHVLRESDIPAEVFNNFFPPEMHLTGSDINSQIIVKYLEKAFGICSLLGIKTIVFGSGGARNVPSGFLHIDAKNQLIGLLRLVNRYASAHNIMIAIEPLRRQECNIVNTYREAQELQMAANVPNVRCLLDFYHLSEENEEITVIHSGAGSLEHVHISNPAGRSFPLENERTRFREYYSHLRQAGYNGRVSIEAYSSRFMGDATESLHMLRDIENELKINNNGLSKDK